MNKHHNNLENAAFPRAAVSMDLARSSEGNPGIEFRALLGALTRQFRLILGSVLVCSIIAIAVLSQLNRRYTAEALLVIDQRESQLVGLDDTIGVGESLNSVVDTEVEILNSSAVLLGVIGRLQLWKDQEFGFKPPLIERLLEVTGFVQPTPDFANVATFVEVPKSERAELVDNLTESIRINRVGLTNIISVDATSRSPEKAARIANAMLESYLEVQIEARVQAAQRAADFLAQRVDNLAGAIQRVDQEIDDFVISQSDKVGTSEGRAEIKRIRDEIGRFNSSQEGLAVELSQLRQLQTANGSEVFSEFPRLTGQLKLLAEERDKLIRESQKVVVLPDLENRLKVLNDEIRTRAEKRIGDVSQQLSAADTRVSELRKSVLELFGRQQIPNEVAMQLYKLQRGAENSRRLYDSYFQRLGEVQQKANLALPNSRIVAMAIIPHEPSFPPTGLVLALALLCGVILGGVGAAIREHLVGGFASSEQLEVVTRYPVVSVVPVHRGANPEKAIIDEPFSAYSEAIRRLRTNIEGALQQDMAKVFVVTSTEPDEGKSTIAVSLGRAFALAGHKTLLMDGDLRRPSISGLTSATTEMDCPELISLSGSDEVFRGGVTREADSGLLVLSLTPKKRYMSDLVLASKQFEQLLTELREKFDVILIDTPPIGYLVDAKLICRLADACLFVVRQNAASQRDVIAGVRELLTAVRSLPVGLVLSRAKDSFAGYHYLKKNYTNYYSEK